MEGFLFVLISSCVMKFTAGGISLEIKPSSIYIGSANIDIRCSLDMAVASVERVYSISVERGKIMVAIATRRDVNLRLKRFGIHTFLGNKTNHVAFLQLTLIKMTRLELGDYSCTMVIRRAYRTSTLGPVTASLHIRRLKPWKPGLIPRPLGQVGRILGFNISNTTPERASIEVSPVRSSTPALLTPLEHRQQPVESDADQYPVIYNKADKKTVIMKILMYVGVSIAGVILCLLMCIWIPEKYRHPILKFKKRNDNRIRRQPNYFHTSESFHVHDPGFHEGEYLTTRIDDESHGYNTVTSNVMTQHSSYSDRENMYEEITSISSVHYEPVNDNMTNIPESLCTMNP